MSDELKAKVAELSQQYRSRLPQQLSQVVEIFQKLQGRWNSYGSHELANRLHVMKGAAGTFGLPQVSDAAEDLLQILQQEVCSQ